MSCKKSKSLLTYGNPDSLDIQKLLSTSDRDRELILMDDPNKQEVLARTIKSYRALPAVLRLLDRFEESSHVRFLPMEGPVSYKSTYERFNEQLAEREFLGYSGLSGITEHDGPAKEFFFDSRAMLRGQSIMGLPSMYTFDKPVVVMEDIPSDWSVLRLRAYMGHRA